MYIVFHFYIKRNSACLFFLTTRVQYDEWANNFSKIVSSLFFLFLNSKSIKSAPSSLYPVASLILFVFYDCTFFLLHYRLFLRWAPINSELRYLVKKIQSVHNNTRDFFFAIENQCQSQFLVFEQYIYWIKILVLSTIVILL